MPLWEERFYRPLRVISPVGEVDATVYDLDKATAAYEQMQAIPLEDLRANLTKPGQVCYLPFPGIGLAPRRPGGDFTFVARAQTAGVFDAFFKACRSKNRGQVLCITGPKGIGKSCYLRALAWLLFLTACKKKPQTRRIVCLWSMEPAYKNLLAELLAGLRFTYCQEQDVFQEIDSLGSLKDVENFMDDRLALGEMFYFIVDEAEVLDTNTSKGTPRPDRDHRAAVDTQLSNFLNKAHVSIKALSPMDAEQGFWKADTNTSDIDHRAAAVDTQLSIFLNKSHVSIQALSPMADSSSRKRKADTMWIHAEQGFWKAEYDAYMNKVSILGRLPQWQEDIDYFAGEHPYSLSVLDASCRRHAQNRCETRIEWDFDIMTSPELTDEDIVELLKDKDEWDEAVKLFVTSAEMVSIRKLLESTLSSMHLSSACHSQVSMMELDMRFAVGDPKSETPHYVTPYISRIYTEGFREAESRTVYQKTAWQHYCRYLLDQGGQVNWAEMGWLVENLAAEVIAFRGLKLDGMSIHTNRTERFVHVPDYYSWISEVEAGGAIYFIPLKYNHRSIDGLIVWRDGSGVLHVFAIQVTFNHDNNQASADEFMSFNTIINWIPEEHLSKWELHFVFLSTQTLAKKFVPECLNQMRSGGCYGNVKYSLHTVSFEDSFAGMVSMDVLSTLKDVARNRDMASEPAAERAAQ